MRRVFGSICHLDFFDIVDPPLIEIFLFRTDSLATLVRSGLVSYIGVLDVDDVWAGKILWWKSLCVMGQGYLVTAPFSGGEGESVRDALRVRDPCMYVL